MWSFTKCVVNIDTSSELFAVLTCLFVIVSVNCIRSMKVKFYCVMSFIVSKIKEFPELCY